MDPARYFIHTLGCKTNLVDSQLIESELQRRGWSPADDEDHPDIRLYIVNSCTVTDEADRQSRKSARRFSRRNPDAKVLYTGCSAEASPGSLSRASGIDYVVGNRDKPSLVQKVLDRLQADEDHPAERPVEREPHFLGSTPGYEEFLSRHPIDREWPLPEELGRLPAELNSRRARSFLKIQEGCNSFCTFCIIPYGRGPSRSLPLDAVVGKISELVAGGTREVILTGTNLGDYGRDWADDPQIESLCEAILTRTALSRLRISSLDPSEITPRLIELMVRKAPRFCPHFHVSLQSPHSKILRLMKREYGSEEVFRCLHALGRMRHEGRGPYVGMDVITGFPGETDEDFEKGLNDLKDLPWTRLHVFPYSERSGTPATRLPLAVPVEERKRRARVLSALSFERVKNHYQCAFSAVQNARVHDVLLESATRGPDASGDWILGHTPDYLRILVPLEGRDPESLRNRSVSARVGGITSDPIAGDAALVASEAIFVEQIGV